jgi:hypothetical protein
MREQPKRPSKIVWMLVMPCALVALGYFRVLDHRIAYGVAATIAIGIWIMSVHRQRRYERDLLDWKIKNARGWVAHFEAKLSKPQPWFAGEDPEEYQFQARQGLENWKSTLLELESRRG